VEVHTVFGDAPPDSLLRNVVISVRSAEGGLGVIASAFRDDQSRTSERLELVGTRGSIVVDDVTRGVQITTSDPDLVVSYRANHFVAGDSFYESLTSHVQDFIAHVAQDRRPPVPGLEGLRGMQIAAAAMESSRRGQPVELKD
jgi:predicted dehydrogenase